MTEWVTAKDFFDGLAMLLMLLTLLYFGLTFFFVSFSDVINREETGSKVAVPRELLEQVLEDLIDLRSERHWWKKESRLGYSDIYKELNQRIDRLEALLKEEEQS